MGRLIDATDLMCSVFATKCSLVNGKSEWLNGYRDALAAVLEVIEKAHSVDAIEMPKGKPGDYLEWDNGAGFKQVYCIGAVMICEDCMRYELANFTPVVNHPNIVRIMSREEAEKELRDRWAREIVKEEPNLTACGAKMDGDGNG